jgi:hypothetical protein
MVDIINWPICLLRPQAASANVVPFTRSGGASLGGIERTVRTDLGYSQSSIVVISEGATPIGATIIRLRIIDAAQNLAGVRFSFNHALYETGPVLEIEGDVWTVPIWPSVRELIPSGSDLEFDMPTCLCRLVQDRGMDIQSDYLRKSTYPSVSFLEATDYWNDLALGLI